MKPQRKKDPLDYIYQANMIDGTVRFVGTILAFIIVVGSIFHCLAPG